MVPLAIVTAVVIVAGWFPATALWHQQAQIDTTASQITALQHQEQSLQRESKSIDSKAAAIELAREQYQLVAPGQGLIQVLPENSAGEASSSDPGFQPLVSPTAAAPLTVSKSAPKSGHRAGFVSRLVRTLEFWR
jgi:hypothetical protein